MTITTKKSETRGHHYLSKCYLKGFSIPGDPSTIIPIDLVSSKVQPPANLRKVAKERDFNRVNIDGIAPNYLEDALAQHFEGHVATALRNIEKTRQFIEEDRIIILNLIALFAVRNPSRRDQYNYVMNHIYKTILSIAAQNVGGTSNGVLITDEFKKFVDEDNYKLVSSKNEHIQAELRIFNEMLPYFFHRKWALIQSPEGAEFITSDFPVVLIWTEQEKHKFAPGFGLSGTQIHFALSKQIALVGDFEGIDEVSIASKETVALINTNIISFARRWIYTSNQSFYFLTRTGECSNEPEKFWSTFTASAV